MNDNGSPPETVFGYSEVTATWTTRYTDPSGFECLLSLQAETGAGALQKAQGAITHLIKAKCLPVVHRNNHNGHQDGLSKKSDATVMVKQDGNPKICPIHNIEMTKWSKNGRSWYAHRWNDGFCHGEKS